MSVKVGIALGGGGARGIAHFGVLKALEQEGISIDRISGTSIGALVGAMYAQNPDADFLIERFKQSLDEAFYTKLGVGYLKTKGAREGSFFHQATQNIKRQIVLNIAQSRKALIKEVRLRDVLLKFIEEGNIENTRIPLSVVATSLHTGDDVVFTKGDIINAVAASCSIPGFLPPLCVEDDLLADGGVSCPVPVKVLADMGADITIGVEICMRRYHPLENLNIIEIVARAEMITSQRLAGMMVDTADVAISPDTKDIYWSEFSRADELIEAGIKGAKERLGEIREAIRKKTPWYKRIFIGK
jgi:NTE family protein